MRPEPVPAINDVLIRVRRAGICGTDLLIYNWDEWAQNLIPGHLATLSVQVLSRDSYSAINPERRGLWILQRLGQV